MAQLPLSAEPFSLRSSSGSEGAGAFICGLPIVCSRSPSCTCFSCLRRSWPITAPIGHPSHRLAVFGVAPIPSDPNSLPISFNLNAVLPASRQTRSNMRYVVLIGALITAATLGGCTEGVLDPKGPIAFAERQILFDSLGIMLAIVIPTILTTLGVAWWFRASNTRARYQPNFSYSGRLDLLVWSIPIMTVLLVGGVASVGSYDLDPPKAIVSAVKPIRVQVVSLDWKWLFIYPDQGVAAVNQLTVPVGTPISFELTSSGVMNSFLV